MEYAIVYAKRRFVVSLPGKLDDNDLMFFVSRAIWGNKNIHNTEKITFIWTSY